MRMHDDGRLRHMTREFPSGSLWGPLGPAAIAACMLKMSYNFIDEPAEDLKCLICKGVAVEPWQHGKCGRLFCKRCLEGHGKDKPCPECGILTEEQTQYFEDSRSKKNISVLRVKCANVDKECGWEGTVGTFDEHVAMCKFMLVPCPNLCNDDNGVSCFTRKNLDEHLENRCPNRDFKCKYCEENGTFVNITQNHYQVCTRKPVQCPNAECTRMVLQSDMRRHLDVECEYTEVSCKYLGIGCNVRTIRKDIMSHEQDDDKLHLHLALDTVAELKSADKPRQKMPTGLTFKLSNFEQKKEQNEKFVSPLFHTSHHGYDVAVRVDTSGHGDATGTHLSIFALVLTGEYDTELTWPFQGRVAFTLLNQLEDREHFEKSLKVEASHNVRPGDLGRGFFKFVPHSALAHDPVKNTQYLKDDTLYFRVSVEVDDHKPWLECKAV